MPVTAAAPGVTEAETIVISLILVKVHQQVSLLLCSINWIKANHATAKIWQWFSGFRLENIL